MSRIGIGSSRVAANYKREGFPDCEVEQANRELNDTLGRQVKELNGERSMVDRELIAQRQLNETVAGKLEEAEARLTQTLEEVDELKIRGSKIGRFQFRLVRFGNSNRKSNSSVQLFKIVKSKANTFPQTKLNSKHFYQRFKKSSRNPQKQIKNWKDKSQNCGKFLTNRRPHCRRWRSQSQVRAFPGESRDDRKATQIRGETIQTTQKEATEKQDDVKQITRKLRETRGKKTPKNRNLKRRFKLFN
jgi:hypothetical protein